jgi:hypothetical protein
MANPVQLWKGIDKGDRYMLLSSIVIPVLFWWYYVGRKRYGTKGMR